mmetsp:Transcript_2274/g.3906  ORF Transcript_2274/g.3906 Transcript_2274/m.3906 type:complete len:231 (+) Transcript_2274:124-816(+)
MLLLTMLTHNTLHLIVHIAAVGFGPPVALVLFLVNHFDLFLDGSINLVGLGGLGSRRFSRLLCRGGLVSVAVTSGRGIVWLQGALRCTRWCRSRAVVVLDDSQNQLKFSSRYWKVTFAAKPFHVVNSATDRSYFPSICIRRFVIEKTFNQLFLRSRDLQISSLSYLLDLVCVQSLIPVVLLRLRLFLSSSSPPSPTTHHEAVKKRVHGCNAVASFVNEYSRHFLEPLSSL